MVELCSYRFIECSLKDKEGWTRGNIYQTCVSVQNDLRWAQREVAVRVVLGHVGDMTSSLCGFVLESNSSGRVLSRLLPAAGLIAVRDSILFAAPAYVACSVVYRCFHRHGGVGICAHVTSECSPPRDRSSADTGRVISRN
jgi:hypothetical protein